MHKIAVILPAGTSFYDRDDEYITEELPRTLYILFLLSGRREGNFIAG